MNSLSESSRPDPAVRRPLSGVWVAGGWAAAVAGLGLAGAWLLGHLVAGPLHAALPALLLGAVLGVGVLLLAVALTWHVAVRLTRQQLGSALHQSRQHLHQLEQLQRDWLWQSDAQHHLLSWQAPLKSAPGESLPTESVQLFWDRFSLVQAGEGASLQQRLNSQQDFEDLLVMGPSMPPVCPDGRWLISGQLSWDEMGHFAGYRGTARPAAQGLTGGAGAAATSAWMAAFPGPAWLLSVPGAKPEGGVRLLELNEPAAQLMGCAADQVRGQSWRLCQEALPEELRTALSSDGFQSGQACGSWWLCLTDLGGSGTGSGAVAGHLLSLWPQGGLQTLPAALAHDAAEVARADQDAFSYTVSHDLRAPLRVVEGFARILKEDYGRLLDRIGNDHLDRVMGAAARMNSMIDALLTLSQLSTQPLARQPVNFSQLAQFVVDDVKSHWPERDFEVHIQPGLQVHGDPTLLRMVLENLLGNAFKYSSKADRPVIRFESRQDAGQRVFVVSDNGAGFDMRFADRLFGVFQRLHSASDFQGTGVGLASVRRILRRHGGDIWAESEVGKGARFFFTLRD